MCAALVLGGCGAPISSKAQARNGALEQDGVSQSSWALPSGELIALGVRPGETDGGVKDPRWQSEHYVWLDPAVEHRGKLFVFLPAQRHAPAMYQSIAKEAARAGYHVIVLSYANTVGVAGGIDSICKASDVNPAFATCQEHARLQILDGPKDNTGQDLLPAIPGLTRGEGIYNRLTKLLEHLETTVDGEWSQFLHRGEPQWKKIVVSGLSYGGAEATLIGKYHSVQRVVLFGAPRDGSGTEPNPWVAIGKTAPKRHYGLVHVRDPMKALTLASWGSSSQGCAPLTEPCFLAMSQFGEAVQEDLPTSAPPYGRTHMLLTDRDPLHGSEADCLLPPPPLPLACTTAGKHSSVVLDVVTPTVDDVQGGTPLLRDAWRYMLAAHDGDDADEDSDRRE